eukprot:scaffold32022_cov200-Skeletonema_dohrnii-CCMP3373.AAC.1
MNGRKTSTLEHDKKIVEGVQYCIKVHGRRPAAGLSSQIWPSFDGSDCDAVWFCPRRMKTPIVVTRKLYTVEEK